MNDTQLQAVMSRLDALSTQVAFLVERQKKQEELIDELVMPVAKEFVRTATDTLATAEKKGYFAFGRELLGVAERIVQNYSANDVRELGNAITTIVDTVRSMTQPEVLAIAGDATEVLQNAEKTEPIGLLGMVRATRNDDVGRGIALTLEILRRVGKGANAIAVKQVDGAAKRAKVNSLLAPKRRTPSKALGVERTRVAPSSPRPFSSKLAPPPPPAGAPSKPAPAAVIDGVAFNADGHLADPKAWTRQMAETLAAAQGVAMGPEHWKIIDFARGDWESTKASPNIRRITQGTGIQTKALYTLFPKAPARTVAKIAGIPKPAGCI